MAYDDLPTHKPKREKPKRKGKRTPGRALLVFILIDAMTALGVVIYLLATRGG
ncbi:hypothetical protein G4Y79_23715 [Phototrophicus methaneseepsis]|uniref:Uncharacterized protein n=1 Tax=Phototrophicus methaneseepsis TaxID=2710758 RepID=A0A7S8E9B6_9CHLR|nr:hypothetical protein [Phototrophicus methaneseepsis]QPC82658.1 hypothetical protein G4Y79_23715 [Phototrophicus methaneseepsis]